MGGRMEDAVLPWPNRGEVTTHPPPRTQDHHTTPPNLPACFAWDRGGGSRLSGSPSVAPAHTQPTPAPSQEVCRSSYVCMYLLPAALGWAGLLHGKAGCMLKKLLFYMLTTSACVRLHTMYACAVFPPRTRQQAAAAGGLLCCLDKISVPASLAPSSTRQSSSEEAGFRPLDGSPTGVCISSLARAPAATADIGCARSAIV